MSRRRVGVTIKKGRGAKIALREEEVEEEVDEDVEDTKKYSIFNTFIIILDCYAFSVI